VYNEQKDIILVTDFVLHNGNCIDVLKTMEENSVDSVVTDPPYELGFMGKSWDSTGIAYSVDMWSEVMRVLKPGGHLLAFSGTRTYHRMVVAIEDAGFEIRDQIGWVFGSGFPHGLNIGKAIDATLLHGSSHSTGIKKTNETRPGDSRNTASLPNNGIMSTERKTNIVNDNAATEEAKRWEGWNTSLKPAFEPVCVARKPLSEKTVAKNVLKHGTGGINIDDCRIDAEEGGRPLRETAPLRDDVEYSGNALAGRLDGSLQSSRAIGSTNLGRFPANIIHSRPLAKRHCWRRRADRVWLILNSG